jgi:hypothetical protein
MWFFFFFLLFCFLVNIYFYKSFFFIIYWFNLCVVYFEGLSALQLLCFLFLTTIYVFVCVCVCVTKIQFFVVIYFILSASSVHIFFFTIILFLIRTLFPISENFGFIWRKTKNKKISQCFNVVSLFSYSWFSLHYIFIQGLGQCQVLIIFFNMFLFSFY